MRKQGAERISLVTEDVSPQNRTYVWRNNSGAHGVQQVQECGLPLLPGRSHSCHGIVQGC